MSTKYVVVKESSSPGCLGITIIIGFAIGLIYGIYRGILAFVEWVQTLNPFSIAIFFCLLALVAGIVFLVKFLYKYVKYLSVQRSLDYLNSDLLDVEDAYLGQKRLLQNAIDEHARVYKSLPSQIKLYPELGIKLKDDNDFLEYVNILGDMSKAVDAKSNLLPDNSLDEEALKKAVAFEMNKCEYDDIRIHFSLESEGELLKHHTSTRNDYIENDKNIEKIVSYSGYSRASIRTALADIAEGEFALKIFQNRYYRFIKDFVSVHYNQVLERIHSHKVKCIALAVVWLVVFIGCIGLNFARISWDEEAEKWHQSALLAQEQENARVAAEQQQIEKMNRINNEISALERYLNDSIETELKNEEFGILNRTGLIKKTYSGRIYPTSMKNSEFVNTALNTCQKKRENCCELSLDSYREKLSEYKAMLASLTLILAEKLSYDVDIQDVDIENIFSKLDDIAFKFVVAARGNKSLVTSHLIYEEIVRHNFYSDGTNVLYQIWLLSNISYAIKDCYSLLANSYSAIKPWNVYEVQSLSDVDKLHSKFENAENYECNVIGKDKALKPVGKKSNSYHGKKNAVHLTAVPRILKQRKLAWGNRFRDFWYQVVA